jgi:hypothetical protein
MSLADVDEVRTCIARVAREEFRYCLMATYLFDARISEVVSRACPKDTTTARGPKGSDAKLDSFLYRGSEIPCVVFTVKTAKRKRGHFCGKEHLRYIGLPLEEEYEPFTKPLYGYFLRAGDRPVFDFTRQTIWEYVKDKGVFKDLTYPITEYGYVPAHDRLFRLHALRHLRASELTGYYGFDGFQLATYGGWTYHVMAQTSPVMDRYLSLSWQSYFEKLLKKRQRTDLAILA